MAATLTITRSAVWLLLICTLACFVVPMKLDFTEFMNQHRVHPIGQESKRGSKGNNCPSDMPFPCKTTGHCIPMKYLCDDNIDCEDGYDEDRDVCTAARRPAVDQIVSFLHGEKAWIMKAFFGNKDIGNVAHALAVSESMEDFRTRLNMPAKYMEALRTGLEAVRDQEESVMTDRFNMPDKSWGEVEYIFSKLVNDNFID